MLLEVAAKVRGRRIEGGTRTGRQYQKLFGPRRRRCSARRRFFEHDVRVRAADAQRAESGTARGPSFRPGQERRVHVEGTLLEAELRVRRLEVQGRRDRLLLKAEH